MGARDKRFWQQKYLFANFCYWSSPFDMGVVKNAGGFYTNSIIIKMWLTNLITIRFKCQFQLTYATVFLFLPTSANYESFFSSFCLRYYNQLVTFKRKQIFRDWLLESFEINQKILRFVITTKNEIRLL